MYLSYRNSQCFASLAIIKPVVAEPLEDARGVALADAGELGHRAKP